MYAIRSYYAPVEVVGLDGWERRSLWDDTGLPWSPPSPAMPTPAAALAYPGACLLEGTNLSEGRGTARPFDLVGAPWIDGERLREELAALGLPGVVFSSLYFRPSSSKYAGEDCGGALLSVVDPRAFRSLDCGVAVVRTAKALCVITSYSIHYTKLYDRRTTAPGPPSRASTRIRPARGPWPPGRRRRRSRANGRRAGRRRTGAPRRSPPRRTSTTTA